MNRNHGHRLLLTLILPLLILFFTACAGDGSDSSTSAPATAASQVDTVENAIPGVIFTAEQIAASEHWPNNDAPWTPSEADILALEEQLPGFLEEEYSALWQKLESYTRQYWGTVTADGNRAIYANFFCDADAMDRWRTDFVMVLDGGDCYFQTLYDIEDGVFVWLAINGES